MGTHPRLIGAISRRHSEEGIPELMFSVVPMALQALSRGAPTRRDCSAHAVALRSTVGEPCRSEVAVRVVL